MKPTNTYLNVLTKILRESILDITDGEEYPICIEDFEIKTKQGCLITHISAHSSTNPKDIALLNGDLELDDDAEELIVDDAERITIYEKIMGMI